MLQHLIVLGRLAILIQEQPVKSEIYLQDLEMFEVLLHAIHGKNFFDKSSSANGFASLGQAASIAVLGVNLPDPAGIPVTGSAHEDLGMETAKIEVFHLALIHRGLICCRMLLALYEPLTENHIVFIIIVHFFHNGGVQMPYISLNHRQALDPLIDKLALQIVREAQVLEYDAAFAGLLNYTCTRLALKTVRHRFGAMRYWIIAILTGTFKNISDEFYRRIAAAYENRQMEKSGDVDMFREYELEISGD